MHNNEDFQTAYDRYFLKSNTNEDITNTANISKEEEDIDDIKSSQTRPRLSAFGNIDDIDKLGDELRKLLNATWGSDWGTLNPATSTGEDADDITLPQIRYSTNLREIASGTSPKPTLMDSYLEEVDGKKTGEYLRVYRQYFDCIVEFNYLANTSKDCNKLMLDFEELILTYTGYLKQKGIQEIFFLKEVPAKYSLNNKDKIPMKCCYFYVKLERNKTIRASAILDIDAKIEAETNIVNNTEKLRINNK